jgi:hypothetical protein
MATPPTPQPPRVLARDAVHRCLGNPTGQAQKLVADLTDDEIAAINAAAADKRTARAEIKRIFAKAHERRSESAAAEARQRQTSLRRLGLARKVLERELQLAVPESVSIAGDLSEAELEVLAGFEREHDCADRCRAVLQGALARLLELSNTRHVNAGSVDVLTRAVTGFDPLDPPEAGIPAGVPAAEAATDVGPEEPTAIEPVPGKPAE